MFVLCYLRQLFHRCRVDSRRHSFPRNQTLSLYGVPSSHCLCVVHRESSEPLLNTLMFEWHRDGIYYHKRKLYWEHLVFKIIHLRHDHLVKQYVIINGMDFFWRKQSKHKHPLCATKKQSWRIADDKQQYIDGQTIKCWNVHMSHFGRPTQTTCSVVKVVRRCWKLVDESLRTARVTE